jgi:hypothetical protein
MGWEVLWEGTAFCSRLGRPRRQTVTRRPESRLAVTNRLMDPFPVHKYQYPEALSGNMVKYIADGETGKTDEIRDWC